MGNQYIITETINDLKLYSYFQEFHSYGDNSPLTMIWSRGDILQTMYKYSIYREVKMGVCIL